jgi:hypothetical protein
MGILCNKNGPERLELFLVTDTKAERERESEEMRLHRLEEKNRNTDLE